MTPRSRTADDPLPFEQLRALDLELDLQADRVTGRADLEIVDLATAIHLEDGELSIRHASGGYEAGDVQLELRVDARTPVPHLALRAEASGVDITRLALQLDPEAEAAGLLDASLDLRSRGSTPAELRSHLEGELRAVLRGGTLASRYARAFVKQLLKASIPSLLMPKQAPKLSCLVADFGIEDGVATAKSFFLDAPAATISAVGRVDLARDRLDLRLTPRPRDPGLLSVAATVDVRGPIAAPEFSPVPRSVATSLAQGLLANAMKPAGVLLSPLRGRAREQEDPCASGIASGDLAEPSTPRARSGD